MNTQLVATKAVVFEVKMPQTFRLQEQILVAYINAARMDNPHMDHQFQRLDVKA